MRRGIRAASPTAGVRTLGFRNETCVVSIQNFLFDGYDFLLAFG
ncbi:hypothetical protein FRUB_02468 [Fimbriiglobus ruber]|uniref:Uncharacterized protein n=1 Tax=Fimbriiglobus ruber TaxID=1908690 RepID=A0A225E381_9BACT|nr:hypothetical protein FRUB_02468 [Fimbriiglobus ruber]